MALSLSDHITQWVPIITVGNKIPQHKNNDAQLLLPINTTLEGKMSEVCESEYGWAWEYVNMLVWVTTLRTRAPHGSAIGRPSTRDLRHAISLHTFTFP